MVLKSLKKTCQGKKSFVAPWPINNDTEYDHVLQIWNTFETKTMKVYHDLDLDCDVLFLADVFEKFANISLIIDYVQVIIWAHQL